MYAVPEGPEANDIPCNEIVLFHSFDQKRSNIRDGASYQGEIREAVKVNGAR